MANFITKILIVILTTAIGRGLLLWLGTKQIYPEHWIAELIGLAETNITSYPSISWILSGVFGLLCLYTWHHFFNSGAPLNPNKPIMLWDDWKFDDKIVKSLRSLSSEFTNVSFTYYDGEHWKFHERLGNTFSASGWDANFTRGTGAAQGRHSSKRPEGIEVIGDSRVLVDSIASALEASGLGKIKPTIRATEIKPNHPTKYDRAKNAIWIIIGYQKTTRLVPVQ